MNRIAILAATLLLSAAPVLSAADSAYSWRSYSDGDADVISLWKEGKQVGMYRYSADCYYPLADGKWGRPCPLPTPAPGPGPGRPNYGVDAGRVTAGKTTINGKDATKAEALAAIGGPAIPDDAKLPRLTIIGAEADCQKVLADLKSAPALQPFQGHFLVQDYRPTDWPVSCGFKTDGKPAIYAQAADGTVLHRQDAYAGPEELAAALRKADPLYKPAADPNLTQAGDPVAGFMQEIQKVPMWLWIVAAVLLFLYWRNHHSTQPPAAK